VPDAGDADFADFTGFDFDGLLFAYLEIAEYLEVLDDGFKSLEVLGADDDFADFVKDVIGISDL
jgi:hypothetical protein